MATNATLPSGHLDDLGVEEIRAHLCVEMARIATSDVDEAPTTLDAFAKLRRKHFFAFRKAWTIDPDTEWNTLFGFTVSNALGAGAFGRVYRAFRSDGGGEQIAIKVLDERVLDDVLYLAAFRRGVYALRMLSERRVPGVVGFSEAHEAPACVAMELVDGRNLEEAFRDGLVSLGIDRLRIVLQVARIVLAAHSTPEGVIHRDVKPANVMLRGYDPVDGDLASRICLVDFDLCWHQQALASTISFGAAATMGYAAPEFFDKALGSTRVASVDVFGLSMLLYYCLVGSHPKPGESHLPNFRMDIRKLLTRRRLFKWPAVAWQISDVLADCGARKPLDRYSVPMFISALEAAMNAEMGDDSDSGRRMFLRQLA